MSNNTEAAIIYYKSIAHRVQEYTKPLRLLDIHSFGYIKALGDGRYLLVSDNYDFTLEYIEKIPCIDFKHSTIKPIDLNKRELQLIEVYNSENTTGMKIAAKYDCWNFISLLKAYSDHVEVWWFAGDKNHIVPKLLARSHDLLKAFLMYFNTQAIDIINTDQSNFRVFENQIDVIVQNNEPFQKNSEKAKKFLQEIQVSYFKIWTPQGIFKISTREAECLKFLSNTNSAKEIAKILGISPRTVETHLYNVKYKTSCKSKQNLVSFYREYLSKHFDL